MGSLAEEGYDPAETPIPVAPAAHYTVGGILTDLDGRTELAGLYAAGESAATGVHGANRLASNSLLECLVFGRRAASPRSPRPAGPAAQPTGALTCRARNRRAPLPALGGLWSHSRRGRSPPASVHVAPAPRLIAESALTREESRGSHFRLDFPVESSVRTTRRPATGRAALPRAMAVATDTLERIVLAALAEDVGQGDVTTDATVPADAIGTAELLVQERGVVCGLRAAETTFRALDPDLEFDVLVAEGSAIEGPRGRAAIRFRARDSHRRAGGLNFLGRLSGIATLTRRYVDAVAGTRAAILDAQDHPRPACTRARRRVRGRA